MMDDWFSDGLSFECTRCGDCCRGEPGYVWVTLEEAGAIAASVAMPFRDFESSCLRRIGRKMSLLEKPNGDCILWQDGKGCTVYDVRPLQCRTFPFWSENIRSAQAWHDLAARCPGVDKGRRFSADEIRRMRDRTR